MTAERREIEPEPPLNPFKNMISSILSDKNGDFEGMHYLANIYREFSMPENQEELQIMQQTLGIEGTGEELFAQGLGQVIEDISVKDLNVIADAIHLACHLEIWEVDRSISYLKVILAQVNDQDKGEWVNVIRESNNFEAYKPKLPEKTVFPTSITSSKQDRSSELPDVFSDFINTLNLDDFTGKRG